MKPVPTLIDRLGGYRTVAALMGLAPTTVASWKSRNSIAVEHWPKLISAARERGLEGISYEKLVEIHSAPERESAA